MSVEVNRLRWQCRRGHLELDLLLQRFLETGYAGLDSRSRTSFAQLLRQSDETLLSWLVGCEPVSEPEFQTIVAYVRAS